MPQPTKPDGERSNRKFTVLHTFVGPWAQGATFSEQDFRLLNPAPAGVDAEAFHEGNIQRLLDLGAVAPALSDAHNPPPAVGPLFTGSVPPAVNDADKKEASAIHDAKGDHASGTLAASVAGQPRPAAVNPVPGGTPATQPVKK